MSTRSSVLLLALVAVIVLAGCPGKQIITNTPTVEDADDQQATCKVAKDPLNPLVVEWPGTAKVELETVSRRGLVAVSYSGCRMKILASCEVKGGYTLEKTTPARDRLEIADNNELYAKLPLGAASLKGELSAGSSLELDYIAVGQRIADDQPVETAGECDGATHYVRTITVGAFQLDAKAKGKAGVAVEVGSAGAGVGREENVRKLRSQGDVARCQADPASTDCGAILQLGLSPLRLVSGGKATSGGFGQGLAPIAEVYQVKALGEIEVSGSTSLQAVDVTFLKLLQTAKRADKEEKIAAATKAKAWDAIARYEPKSGENPWRDRAKRRAEEWAIVAEQEERQREALATLKARFLADKAKLNDLLELDDEVVSPEQKEAYQNEFIEVYSARSKELALVGLKIKVSGSGAIETQRPKGKSSATPTEKDKGEDEPTPLGTGLAGFGHFSIEAELGVVFSNAPVVSIGGQPTAYHHGDIVSDVTLGTQRGELHTNFIMLGLVVATPELIPGGFGFYGAFRGIPGGSDDSATRTDTPSQSWLSASAGVRWDPRITPNGIFTVGAGGGYMFTPGSETFRQCLTAEVQEDNPSTDQNDESFCTGATIADNPQFFSTMIGGPLLDTFVGIGYSNRIFTAAARAWFGATFLSNDNLDFDSTLLFGGFGGQVGIVL